MIYKFNNGGIVKLQKAGSVPEYGNIEQIAKYNREHGTHFWKMSQVLEHDKQQAQQKTQDKKKSFWEILAGHPESPGEAILNKSIETANNAELPETRSKMYNDTGKSQLATTAGSLLTLPMLGEFSTYGLLGGSARLAGGMAGSAVGSYTLGKAGELGDRTFGTTWMKPAGQVIGGFAGWAPGSNIAYKGALDLAFKVPSITRIGATDRFIGDVAGRTLEKNVNSTPFVPAQVKYYGPTMGKSYATKANPNLIDLDTWGRSEYDQLAKKYGYKDWREMILSDKGDYNEEYKQLVKDQISRIQSDPQYSGKTIVVSNASLLKPNSGITFANTPVIPERSVMATRNNIRHPWESIEHGEEWWDSLQRKGTPLSIDNRFVSEIEGNKVIPFTPIPQKPVSTVHFDPKVKLLSRPSPSKIAIDTDERFLSGQNLLYSLDGTSVGPTIDAHGISKGLTSQQLDQLEQILNSGVSKNIYTAPLARTNGVGSAFGTSSGTAYTDGMFIVAGKPGKSLYDGIDTILINSADENYAQALKAYYSKKYPNFNFITYDEAPAHYGVEKKIIPEVKMTTTPIKTNATNKLDINELPPPEEVNFVLKQGGILKAQHGFDLSRLNWTDISNHILGFAADVRNKINKMNKYTPEMVPVIGTDSLKTERRGKIGPFVSARGKDPKIVEDGGEI